MEDFTDFHVGISVSTENQTGMEALKGYPSWETCPPNIRFHKNRGLQKMFFHWESDSKGRSVHTENQTYYLTKMKVFPNGLSWEVRPLSIWLLSGRIENLWRFLSRLKRPSKEYNLSSQAVSSEHRGHREVTLIGILPGIGYEKGVGRLDSYCGGSLKLERTSS